MQSEKRSKSFFIFDRFINVNGLLVLWLTNLHPSKINIIRFISFCLVYCFFFWSVFRILNLPSKLNWKQNDHHTINNRNKAKKQNTYQMITFERRWMNFYFFFRTILLTIHECLATASEKIPFLFSFCAAEFLDD